ncbi:hypothetical protein [Brumimicrobium sp.]|uniref:hypothetical protein n=1 Tax=Brumimicrobium sp. TaxID=2029867 RepID=UPI003A92F371
MSFFYNLIHKKKDIEFRRNSKYLNLSSFGYSISDLNALDFGVKFEKEIDGYYCHVYLTQQKIVLTVFFELSDDAFKEKFKVVERLFNKHSCAGRNFIENRIPFKNITTEEIDRKMNELVAVLKTESFPPMKRDMISLKMLKENRNK